VLLRGTHFVEKSLLFVVDLVFVLPVGAFDDAQAKPAARLWHFQDILACLQTLDADLVLLRKTDSVAEVLDEELVLQHSPQFHLLFLVASQNGDFVSLFVD